MVLKKDKVFSKRKVDHIWANISKTKKMVMAFKPMQMDLAMKVSGRKEEGKEKGR